mgnify:CR=1 FL=1|tara:strand:+ start:356 stop:598 length:243 start_codon:yes stop_codon:yes gene_type:complete
MSNLIDVKKFIKSLDLNQSQMSLKDRKIKEKLSQFASHIEKLSFNAKPDYQFLKKLLTDCITFINEVQIEKNDENEGIYT